jgi:hypothetical protein
MEGFDAADKAVDQTRFAYRVAVSDPPGTARSSPVAGALRLIAHTRSGMLTLYMLDREPPGGLHGTYGAERLGYVGLTPDQARGFARKLLDAADEAQGRAAHERAT